MKKRYLFFCGLLVLTMGMGGCGKQSADHTSGSVVSESAAASETEEASSEITAIDLPEGYTPPQSMDELMAGVDIDSIVELGAYKGLDLTKSIAEVTDAEVESAIAGARSDTYVEVDKAAEAGDTVNITYTAKVDGEKVEDECAENVDLKLGSNKMISGFEDGLIGAKAGDKVKLKLTFPSGYTADLSKKDVTYKVTVNKVETVSQEISEAWVKENTEFATVDEYVQNVRTQLGLTKEAQAEETMEREAWQQVLEGSVVKEYPDALLQYGKYYYEKSISDYCTSNGISLEDYLTQNNLTTEDYQTMTVNYGKSMAGQLLVMAAIEKEENISAADQDYADRLQAMLTETGLDQDTLFQKYDAFSVEQSIMLQRINAIITENANVTENIVENTDAETSAASETSALPEPSAVSGAAETSVASGTAETSTAPAASGAAETTDGAASSQTSAVTDASEPSIDRQVLQPIQ